MTTYAFRPAPRRVGLPAGWWAVAMLIASEGMLFASFVASYYYLRFKAPAWPPPGIPKPAVAVPLALALVLAATSVPMQLAAVAARARRLALTRALLTVALVVQSGYFAMQMHLYLDDLDKFTPATHAYGSLYFLLLGADHGHVALGLLLDVWLLGKLVGGFTTYRLNATQAIAFYWHAVNVLTLIVTGTILSAAV
jgi:heme/copper-type cytochrome/quinol oxidase subunit 3